MLPDFRVRQRDELLAINRLISEELDLSTVLGRILRAASHGIRQEFLRELDPLLSDIPDQGETSRVALIGDVAEQGIELAQELLPDPVRGRPQNSAQHGREIELLADEPVDGEQLVALADAEVGKHDRSSSLAPRRW